MTQLRIIVVLLGTLVTMPIWYILMFHLLKATSQPDWVWLLFWIYMPVSIIAAIISGIVNTIKG